MRRSIVSGLLLALLSGSTALAQGTNYGPPVPIDQGLTAIGNTQATAFLLQRKVNVFTTVNPGGAAILPSSTQGAQIEVYNNGANSLAVYPPRGSAIDSLAVNTPYTLSAGTESQFTSLLTTPLGTSGQWLSAPFGGGVTFNGGTITNSLITQGGINDTGGINTTAAYSINGQKILSVAGAADPNAVLIVGWGAGAAANSTTVEDMFVGTGAGHSFVGGGSSNEIVCVGPLACYYLVTGATHDDFFGDGAGFHETTGNNDTATGGDVMRNTIGVNFGSAYGSFAYANFFGSYSAAFGAQALNGNAASVTFSGPVTAGDVHRLTFTGAEIPTGATTLSYTAQAGDTLSTLVTAFSGAMSGSSALLTADMFPLADPGTSPATIAVSHPGTSAIAPTFVVTYSCTGTCSTVATITGGVASTANNMNFFGYEAGHGLRLTTATRDNCFGTYSCVNFTTAIGVNCFGDRACLNMQSGSEIVAVGDASMIAATNGSNITALGGNTGQNCTICQSVTLLGKGAGASTLVGAIDVIILTPGYTCDTNTSHVALFCGQGGTFLQVNGIGTGTTANAGFSGALQVGSTTPLTLANGELGLIKETASGSAPGATGMKLTAVCGTNAGSLKIIAYGGTSTTPVTVTDNIGTGVTGC